MNPDTQQDELLSMYLDGELSDAERLAVEERLRTDPAARRLLDELRAATDALRGLPREPAPPGVAEAVRARLERRALVEGPGSRDGANGPRSWRGLAYAAVLMLAAGAGIWATPSLWKSPRDAAIEPLAMNRTESAAGRGGRPGEPASPVFGSTAAVEQLAMSDRKSNAPREYRRATRPNTPVDRQTKDALEQLGYLAETTDERDRLATRSVAAPTGDTADELLSKVEQAGRSGTALADQLADADAAGTTSRQPANERATHVGGAISSAVESATTAPLAMAAPPPGAVSGGSPTADAAPVFGKELTPPDAPTQPAVESAPARPIGGDPGSDGDYAMTWTVADAAQVRSLVDTVTRQAADLQIPVAGGVGGALAPGAVGTATPAESVAVTRFDDGAADLRITAPAGRVRELLAALPAERQAGGAIAGRLPSGVRTSIVSRKLEMILALEDPAAPARSGAGRRDKQATAGANPATESKEQSQAKPSRMITGGESLRATAPAEADRERAVVPATPGGEPAAARSRRQARADADGPADRARASGNAAAGGAARTGGAPADEPARTNSFSDASMTPAELGPPIQVVLRIITGPQLAPHGGARSSAAPGSAASRPVASAPAGAP